MKISTTKKFVTLKELSEIIKRDRSLTRKLVLSMGYEFQKRRVQTPNGWFVANTLPTSVAKDLLKHLERRGFGNNNAIVAEKDAYQGKRKTAAMTRQQLLGKARLMSLKELAERLA